jgi:flagellar hook-associated protein 1 FlgK
MTILGNGLSGLAAAQHVLNTTSQNIANANTPGYSRQEAVLASRIDTSPNRLTPGAGVEVAELRRIADDFRIAALWRANNQAGFDNQMETLVAQAEDIIGGSELSVSGGIDSLFAAFNAAAEAPQSMATRQQILSSAASLASRFNQLAGNLDLQKRQIDEQATTLVSGINGQTASIARLNAQIADIQARGGNTSQLEDQRDLAVQKLAGNLALDVQKFPDGRMNVSLSGGQPLVLGSKPATMSLVNGELSLDLKGQVFPITSPGGQLGALQDYRNGTLNELRTSLNGQAERLAVDLNAQLVKGYDLNGDPGAELYESDANDPAASLRLAAGVEPERLGFIGDDGTGNPVGGSGDNTNLLEVITLKSGFYDAYTGLLGNLAIQSAQIQAEASASRGMLADAQSRRDSVSGVSQDEEAVRLMQFTQAYQANAKVVSTAGRVFDTLLGMF